MPSPISNTVQNPGLVSPPSSSGGGFWNGLGSAFGSGLGVIAGGLKNAATGIDNSIGSAIQGFANTAPGTGFTGTGVGTSAGSGLIQVANAQTHAPNVSTGPNQSAYVPPPTSYSFSSPTNTGAGTGTGSGAGAATPPITPPVTPPPVTPPPTTNPNTNTGAAPFSSTVGALQTTAANPSDAFTAAQNQYNQANAQRATLEGSANTALGNLAGSRTNTQFLSGQGSQIQNSLALQEAPLTAEMQAAAQQEGAATSQQGTQQSGLAAAGQLGAPTAANPYGTYNPTQVQPGAGGYTGYGGGQSGTGIGAAAQVTGNLGNGQNFYQNVLPNYNSALNDAQSFNSWLNTPQSQGGGQGINFSSANIANQLQNWAQGQNLSDPRFAQLNTYLNDFTNKMSSVVGTSGGATTNYKQELVNAMIQPDATPQSIQTQMNTIIDVAKASLNGQYNTFNGNANYTPSGAGASGNSQTPSGYTPFFGNQ
jgi:hypothetical protein